MTTRYGLNFWDEVSTIETDIQDSLFNGLTGVIGLRLMWSFEDGQYIQHSIVDDGTCTSAPCSIRDVPARVLIALGRAG